ncbi:MAG: hypothetical protein ACLQGU_04335 [bacterium]
MEEKSKRRGTPISDPTFVENTLDDLQSKVCFLEDFFTCNDASENISEKGKSGLYQILLDMEDDIELISGQLAEREAKAQVAKDADMTP